MINYIKGDATKPTVEGNKFIAHVCNNKGGWGAGFVLAISDMWEEPEEEYRFLIKSKNFKLGDTQLVNVDEEIIVANMIAQDGFKSPTNPTPLDYEALKSCLLFVGDMAKMNYATVHMPKIGCGLAGGKWETVEKIIEECISVDVFVYEID